MRSFLLVCVLALSGCATIPTAPGQRWLVPIEASAAGDRDAPLVVWISGDGGWGRVEREVTRRLAVEGAPTLGVDSLRYFSTTRESGAAAREIADAIEHYAVVWNRSRVVLVGFSFGADVGPFIVHDLPPALRDRLALAVFLSPGKRADFAVGPASWLGLEAGPRVGPVMTSLQPTPVLCVANAGAFGDICPEYDPPHGVVSVRLAGGHTLKNQYDAIVKLILDNARLADH
jgi:type IV secretory pathway VirJ component